MSSREPKIDDHRIPTTVANREKGRDGRKATEPKGFIFECTNETEGQRAVAAATYLARVMRSSTLLVGLADVRVVLFDWKEVSLDFRKVFRMGFVKQTSFSSPLKDRALKNQSFL